jgi:hypothetical protein
MRQLAGRDFEVASPRILSDNAGDFIFIGDLIPYIGLDHGEGAVLLSRKLVLEAAQKIIAEEMINREL